MQNLINFFNSSFFIALVTLIAGLVVLIIYFLRRRDYKKDAANIILLEIQNAERLFKEARKMMNAALAVDSNPNNIVLPKKVSVMKTESWSRYKYLFVRKFDRDQWDAINEFYDNCRLYDEALSQRDLSFSKNETEIRVNIQKAFAAYWKDANDEIQKPNSDREAVQAKYNGIKDGFRKLYLDNSYIYTPQQSVSDAKYYLDNLPTNLSLGQVGKKLKDIAKIKE